MPTLLLIGGLDPSGGAGIAADIETARACGVAVQVIAIALTVQNNNRYEGHEIVSPEWVARQLNLLFEETPPSAIKIGMLPSLAQAQAIASCLREHHWQGPLVWDTVFVSSSGGPLFPLDDLNKIIETLKPHLFGITPNLDEGRILAGDRLLSPEAMPAAIYRRFEFEPPSFILLKGGHGDGDDVCDFLYDGRVLEQFQHHRMLLPHPPRGTGCRLASALGAFLAQGVELNRAVEEAKKMVLNYLHIQTK